MSVPSLIVQQVTGQTPKEADKPEREKNAAAVSLGRLGGLKGGNARSKALTPEQRRAIAKRAAETRWRRQSDSTPMNEKEQLALESLRFLHGRYDAISTEYGNKRDRVKELIDDLLASMPPAREKVGIPQDDVGGVHIRLPEGAHPSLATTVKEFNDSRWLSTVVENYINTRVGTEFQPSTMLKEILAANPEKTASRTSIYPILKRMEERGRILHTQKRVGQTPSKYRVVSPQIGILASKPSTQQNGR